MGWQADSVWLLPETGQGSTLTHNAACNSYDGGGACHAVTVRGPALDRDLILAQCVQADPLICKGHCWSTRKLSTPSVPPRPVEADGTAGGRSRLRHEHFQTGNKNHGAIRAGARIIEAARRPKRPRERQQRERKGTHVSDAVTESGCTRIDGHRMLEGSDATSRYQTNNRIRNRLAMFNYSVTRAIFTVT